MKNNQNLFLQNRLLDFQELQDIAQTKAMLIEENQRIQYQEHQVRLLLATFSKKKTQFIEECAILQSEKQALEEAKQ